MKIWRWYSSEHSAKIKIIGTFETSTSAIQASALLARALKLSEATALVDEPARSSSILDACKSSVPGLTESDANQLSLLEPISAAGTEIRVELGHTNFQALIKVLLAHGARVEVHGRLHSHPQPTVYDEIGGPKE